MLTQQLQGKNILIVGGSSGIGLTLATMLHPLGANVMLTSRNGSKAQSVATSIGPSVKGMGLNIDHETSVKALFDTIPQIDHIYIAAGSTKLGPLSEGTLENNMASFQTRLMGSLRVVKTAIPKMNSNGSITFTGGVSTDRPIAGAWVSGLGTSSAEQLARVLVMEYPHIRFNAVSPGYTDTPMWDAILGDQKTPVLAGIAEKLPVKKIATPNEVAAAVCFLMSNESITGEVIHVDGGARLV